LQVIEELFKKNRLAKGEFVGLGRKLELRQIKVPLYLLAGEGDEITKREQVFGAERLVRTPASHVVKQLANRSSSAWRRRRARCVAANGRRAWRSNWCRAT
jgi:poly-beta-hydroxyalkanoate depolymerase